MGYFRYEKRSGLIALIIVTHIVKSQLLISKFQIETFIVNYEKLINISLAF